MNRLPILISKPLLPPALQCLVAYFYTNNIWVWFDEFERIYQTYEGWERITEEWWRYVLAWHSAGDAQAFSRARNQPEVCFVKQQFAFFALLRRGYIRLHTSIPMPSTLADLEALRLEPHLELEDLWEFPQGAGEWITVEELQSWMGEAEAAQPLQGFSSFADLPPPPKPRPPPVSTYRPSGMPYFSDLATRMDCTPAAFKRAMHRAADEARARLDSGSGSDELNSPVRRPPARGRTQPTGRAAPVARSDESGIVGT